MEKNPKKKSKKDAVDITKIYETIKDKGFIQDLWLDVLSDLRQKPSYVQLKGMVEKVIQTSVENYATQPKDREERLKTRTTFTDLSIMTYTIDTLISELLYKKLKDELLTMISNVIDDHNNRPSSSHVNVQNNSVSMLEDIGKILCNGNVENNETNSNSNKSTTRKRRLSDKSSASQSSVKKGNILTEIKRETSPIESFDSPSCSIVSSTPKLTLNSKRSKLDDAATVEENSYVDVMRVSEDEDDNHSIGSVSSVHTSDLSSFEDDVSISSEDENGEKIKKRVSLKLASELYVRGRLSDLHNSQKKTNKLEENKDSPEVKKSNDIPNQRSSARMRKPNFKYASDDVVCPLKQILPDSFWFDNDVIEKITTPNHSQKKESSISIASKGKKRRPRKIVHSDVSKSAKSLNNSSSSSESDLGDSSSSSSVESNSSEESTQTSTGKEDLQESITHKTSRKDTKVKRGRPPKSISEKPLNAKMQCVLDNMLPNLEKKLQLNSVSLQKSQLNSESKSKSHPELKYKRGRPPKNTFQKRIPEIPAELSEESFAMLEERLCLKDKKINETPSPSRSSKSYDTSDLYKPRSDFRVSFNNSRGSKALTLFSN